MLNKTEEAKINKEEAGSTRPKKAHVITYGCKQNENDSEKSGNAFRDGIYNLHYC